MCLLITYTYLLSLSRSAHQLQPCLFCQYEMQAPSWHYKELGVTKIWEAHKVDLFFHLKSTLSVSFVEAYLQLCCEEVLFAEEYCVKIGENRVFVEADLTSNKPAAA